MEFLRPERVTNAGSGMIVIGVTGGIGSGKSTVCDLLAARGARVFTADLEARRIMERSRAVRRELAALLGADVYRSDGTLDRPLFARRMFADPNLVAGVNRIVHPRVGRSFAAARRKAERDGVPVLVKEAALLLDAPGLDLLDAVVVVTAPEAVRVARVSRREGWSEDVVLARMAHQRSEAGFLAAADVVIDNGGTPEDLEARVDRLWLELLAGRVASRSRG